jgi:hypothetical protein
MFYGRCRRNTEANDRPSRPIPRVTSSLFPSGRQVRRLPPCPSPIATDGRRGGSCPCWWNSWTAASRSRSACHPDLKCAPGPNVDRKCFQALAALGFDRRPDHAPIHSRGLSARRIRNGRRVRRRGAGFH